MAALPPTRDWTAEPHHARRLIVHNCPQNCSVGIELEKKKPRKVLIDFSTLLLRNIKGFSGEPKIIWGLNVFPIQRRTETGLYFNLSVYWVLCFFPKLFLESNNYCDDRTYQTLQELLSDIQYFRKLESDETFMGLFKGIIILINQKRKKSEQIKKLFINFILVYCPVFMFKFIQKCQQTDTWCNHCLLMEMLVVATLCVSKEGVLCVWHSVCEMTARYVSLITAMSNGY